MYDLETKHICSETPESIIQVLELKIDRHEPEYLWIVPAIAEALKPPVDVPACSILMSSATCLTNLAYCSLLS